MNCSLVEFNNHNLWLWRISFNKPSAPKKESKPEDWVLPDYSLALDNSMIPVLYEMTVAIGIAKNTVFDPDVIRWLGNLVRLNTTLT